MMCTCIFCGCEFEKRSHTGRTPIACYKPECQKRLHDKWNEDAKVRHYKAHHMVPKKKKLTLSEVAAAAQAAGMTYGQYVLAKGV